MIRELFTLVKVAAILIVAALLLVISAWAGHIIVFVLVLMTIGVLSWVILHKPESDDPNL